MLIDLGLFKNQHEGLICFVQLTSVNMTALLKIKVALSV